MWLEAIITCADLMQVIEGLLPEKIFLHDEDQDKKERWLRLERAVDIALVANEGLRLVCPAEIAWEVTAGRTPKAKVEKLRVLLRPKVLERHDGNALAFVPEVEEVYFHISPRFIDTTIANAVSTS